MSTALQAPQASQWDSREMIETLKQTVCKGATDAQFRMFVEVCKATGLNPFLKEIWYIPSVGVMAGRDGYLRVANEHPQFDGMSTTVDRDEKGVPIKATCSVWRKDRGHPITCEAYYNEYKKAGSVWSTYPSAMISKVAEVLALKRSFAINGVVTEEEIGQQEERGSKEAQQEVAHRRIHDLKRIPAGSEISPAELAATEPSYEERHQAVVAEAAEILDAPPVKKPASKARGFISFEGLKKWGELKTELRKLTGTDSIYYAALKSKGYDHANEIANEKDTKAIWTALASERTRLKGEAELKGILEQSRERLGGGRFLEVLGANGCEQLSDALELGGTPLSTLLAELKQAVDDLA
jgi:phage recombination protein Bet